MIIVFAITVMWALGTALFTAWFVVEEFYSMASRCVAALVAIPMWAVLGVAPLAYAIDHDSPTLATLQKSEWVCTASHTEESTMYMQAGKVLFPAKTTTSVCDSYGRIK